MGVDPLVSPFEAHVLRMLDRECRLAHHEKNEPKAPSIGESLRNIAAENEKKRELKKVPKKK